MRIATSGKHTPGPWIIDEPPEESTLALGEGIMILADDEDNIARGLAEVYRPDNMLANAHLIAAAPDLLEALEETEAALDMVPCMCEHGFVCSRCKGLDIARKAIAKATGAES